MKFRFLFQIISIALLLSLSSCTIGRMVVYQFSDIKDYKKFPKRELKAAANPFIFPKGDQDAFAKKDIRVEHGQRREFLDSLLLGSKTVAFLVIQRDSIVYERYFQKYEEADPVASFSMAKSYTSALVGIALAEGHIKSVDDFLVDYVPELKEKGLGDIRIRHLLQMTTGVHHAESYFNPFAGVARLYYGRHLRKQVLHLQQEFEAGLYFKYKSINTQLLAEVLVRATGRTLTDYMQEKIWGPIGMEHPASWSIDQKRNGMEKAFCCINATARDFAKFGRLYLQKGNWNGQQLIPESWVEASTKVNAQDGASNRYQYQWWIPSKLGDFSAQGHLGQFIYVNPMKDLIIVRLGKKYGGVQWMKTFREIAAQL
ncbi:MAG TPA: class C beta-lactamase-related serine hydrolase [Bacteroidetes bacterium]|nr:class C beta-lactamase-related serine hydrolase [Bacteroidota bacterium]